ncbi:MAG: cytochrome P450 [Armatimonadetes bacterium]|nr:cytochrome P450 [Armatimonadota bacterium]
MWHRIGQGLKAAIFHAVERAEASGERDLSTRHLLMGLEAVRDAPAAQALTRLGVTAEAFGEALARAVPCEKPGRGPEAALTPEARNAVERAYALARDLGDGEIGGEHLLLAFVREPEASDAGRVLAGLGVTWERAGRALMAVQEWRTRPPEGITVPGLRARRLKARARETKKRVGQLAYALTHSRQPFMPYLLFRKRTTDNPYPFYARLRRDPFYWDELINQWVVTGYEDVVAVLAESRFSHRQFTLSSWGMEELPPLVGREFRRLNGSLGRQMLFLDAPEQTRQRALVAKQFTPRVIARMRDQIQAVTDELLDAVAPTGRMDVIADLAFPLPATVIARMLGVRMDEAAQFKKWSDDFIAYIGGETSLAQDLAAYHSLHDLAGYFRALIPLRRRDPQDDLLTLLIQAEEGGDRLTDDEVIANCLLLLAAGHETTTQLIGNGLLALLRHPDQVRLLRDDPDCIGPAVEELLRYDSPVQWTSRVVREPFEWKGRRFEGGQQVSIGLAAANRDPAQFPDPDRLDITRAGNRHVAFGYGPHFCLGAALARLEGQMALGALLRRFPRLRLESPSVRWHANFTFRALQSLPVRLD